MRINVSLLGGFRAHLDTGLPVNFRRRKAEALIAYLVVRRGEPTPRDVLATLLWGDLSDDQARHNLRQTLFVLKQALPPDLAQAIAVDGTVVAVDLDRFDVDAIAFEAAAGIGTPEALARAADLYGGAFLEGFAVDSTAFEDWLRAERDRLHELVLDVLARLLAHQTHAGLAEPAIQTALRLLTLDALQEPVHRALMRLYLRQGRRGAALRQYQLCVEVLERELSSAPEPDTRRLYQELLAMPSATSAVERPAAPEPPRRMPVEAPAVATPLVGRDVEMATVRSALEEAWRGDGRVLLVDGEAGIGKTRLVEALIAEALVAGGRVLVGRAHENEQVLPLGPWVDAFRSGDAVTDLQMLDAPWRVELGRLFSELGATEREAPAAEDYVRLFEAMIRAVEHLSLRQPILVVLEDLHWADDITMRLLVFLARRLREWPVLVVGTFRGEDTVHAMLLRRSIAQLRRMPDTTSLTLSALSRSTTLMLVESLVRIGTAPDVLERLAEHVWQASEGSPFMVVEMIRAIPSADQVLDMAASTPPSVRDVIAARLDRVSESAARLIAVASVIGREFDFQLLQQASGAMVSDVAEGVEELVGRRILRAVGDRLDFTHERIRELAYERLLSPYRRALHGTVASALEAVHGADVAASALAVGRHYYASENWDRAFAHLVRAARWAAAQAAHRQAIASYELALDALQKLPPTRATAEEQIDLRFELRQSCVPLADPRALQHLAHAETTARAISDRTRLGWTLVFQTHALYLAGRFTSAIEAGERALAIVAEREDAMLEESANVYLAQVYHWVGRYDAALDRLRRDVDILEPRLVARGLACRHFVNTRMLLAWCLAERGDFAEGRRYAQQAIAAAEGSEGPYWLVHACSGAALLELQRGVLESAIAHATRALDLCQGRDYFALWGIPATILGGAFAAAGRSSDAIPLLERALDIGGALVAPVLVFLSQAYLAADRITDAESFASRALRLALDQGEHGWEAWSRWALADVGARTLSAEAACDAFRGALVTAERLGMRPLVARCHAALGRVYRSAAKRQEALEHLTAAIAMFRDLDMPGWLTEVEAQHRTV